MPQRSKYRVSMDLTPEQTKEVCDLVLKANDVVKQSDYFPDTMTPKQIELYEKISVNLVGLRRDANSLLRELGK